MWCTRIAIENGTLRNELSRRRIYARIVCAPCSMKRKHVDSVQTGMLVSSLPFYLSMESEAIDWSKYNLFEKAVFWFALNYKVTLPILLVIITAIMITNCVVANRMYAEEVRVIQRILTYSVGKGKEARKESESNPCQGGVRCL